MTKDSFLPFSKPTISEEAIKEVETCLRSGWLVTGPRVKKFEAMLADYFNVALAQSCTSGTAGLLMALLSLDLQKGDEVITTSMTFAATLNTIVQAGGKPVLVDITADTYNMDVSRLEKAISKKTKAIVPVHFAGVPVDLDKVYNLAKKYKLRVIEDAAHAIGAEYKNKHIGSFGDTQVFSFHPNKNMTTGEGGCVVTRNVKMQKRINALRFHGIDREAWNRYSKNGSQHYDIVCPGYKFNMMDMQAALGIHQLPCLDEFIEKRRQLAHRYYDLLEGWDKLILPGVVSYEHKHAWHLFAPLINIDKTKVDRNTFIEEMKSRRIGIGLHFSAVHLTSYYKENFGYKENDLPVTEFVSDRVVSLPLFPTMTLEEQDHVIKNMKEIL